MLVEQTTGVAKVVADLDVISEASCRDECGTRTASLQHGVCPDRCSVGEAAHRVELYLELYLHHYQVVVVIHGLEDTPRIVMIFFSRLLGPDAKTEYVDKIEDSNDTHTQTNTPTQTSQRKRS